MTSVLLGGSTDLTIVASYLDCQDMSVKCCRGGLMTAHRMPEAQPATMRKQPTPNNETSLVVALYERLGGHGRHGPPLRKRTVREVH
jgi:hypothetical protein